MAGEIKKSLTVVTRVRPPIDGDDAAECLSVSGRQVLVSSSGQTRTFDNDVAYGAHVSTTQLYNEQVEPLVQRVMQGYNATIILYGAGRTGKSYTLSGTSDSDSAGLVNLAAESLFSRLGALGATAKSLVSLAMFDVYSSTVLDLLNPQTKSGLNLLDHRGSGCMVQGLAELVVSTPREVSDLQRQGWAVHEVLESRTQSSQLGRAHSFVDLRVEVVEAANPSVTRQATLRFVCLANSGGVATKFNAGLQALHKVLEALQPQGGGAHVLDAWNVPYGSSRLTRLLESALGSGGSPTLNSICLWINLVEASQRNVGDTTASCEVANRVLKIRGSAPAASASAAAASASSIRVNKNTLANSLRELREEVARVRGKLALSQPGLASSASEIDPGQLKILRGLLGELERVKSNTWERRVARSQELQHSRRANLEQEGLGYVLAEPLTASGGAVGSEQGGGAGGGGGGSGGGGSDIVPASLLEQIRSLRSHIVEARKGLEDQEVSLAEKRSLFALRLETVQRKMAASEEAAARTTPSVAELLKSDEKLAKLDRSASELEDSLRTARAELATQEDEFRRALTRQANLESRGRKVALVARDGPTLERLNRTGELASMRQEAERDEQLQGRIAAVNQEADQAKRALQGANDVQALRDAAMQALEGRREAQESSARFEWERDALWGRLLESRFKNEVAMTRYQEHMFFIFRNYRSHFEEQKDRMETRYREMLESSVKDALKLSEENNKLRAQLDARLKQI